MLGVKSTRMMFVFTAEEVYIGRKEERLKEGERKISKSW